MKDFRQKKLEISDEDFMSCFDIHEMTILQEEEYENFKRDIDKTC